MSPAVASLVALLAVIVASLFSRVNVGVLAMALAWPIALYGAGWKADALIQTFPSSLFLTLVGVSLLFGVSHTNGTMQAVTLRAVRLCRGRIALVPPLLFLLACAVATLGPGAISATALVAPPAMAIGAAAGIPAFLTALMVGNGANAGNLSPISAVGIIRADADAGRGPGWTRVVRVGSQFRRARLDRLPANEPALKKVNAPERLRESSRRTGGSRPWLPPPPCRPATAWRCSIRLATDEEGHTAPRTVRRSLRIPPAHKGPRPE